MTDRAKQYEQFDVGLERDGTVRLSQWNEGWGQVFTREAGLLAQALNLDSMKLYHVGSTSVPGLRAKPVVDILGVVSSLADLDKRKRIFESIGYEYKGEYGIAGRRYAVLYNQEKTKGFVHLHFYHAGHPEIEKHILFRNHLRCNEDARRRYENEKRRLAEDLKIERAKYPEAKSACIQSIMREALADGTPAQADDHWVEGPHIRPINPRSDSEIELVATRMRETLMEVLGEDEGTSMYSMDWLRQRVLFHLNPEMSTAQVYVAEDGSGQIAGHTIVRIEKDESGNAFGLFSTTFVAPEFRNQGIAANLLLTGEKWMLDRGLPEAATYTSDSNTKLISLYKNHGYEITSTYPEKKMIELRKSFGGKSG